MSRGARPEKPPMDSGPLLDHVGRVVPEGDVVFTLKADCPCGCGKRFSTKQVVRWENAAEWGVHKIADKLYYIREQMEAHTDAGRAPKTEEIVPDEGDSADAGQGGSRG